MIAEFKIGGSSFTAGLSKAVNISIPVIFDGPQPNTYDVEKASAAAYEAGEFIGDTRRGGSCNFDKVTMIPHCNGTHTEGVGHISLERIPINSILNDAFIPSVLITVEPVSAIDSNDRYTPDKSETDMIITKYSLEAALQGINKDFLKALIIRTLPNDDSKKSRRYMENPPAFFSMDAMEYIVSLGAEHLLTDLPSLDRTFDEGKLTSHHIYWGVPFESHDVDKHNHSLKTITEMVYAPPKVNDGLYITNIQIPDFTSDAAPSRVLIFPISEV
jgi:hypothetical protein